jgi:hypothetical protein
MGFLFDTGISVDKKFLEQTQNNTSSIVETSNISNSSYDYNYAPIFNLNSAGSDISSSTKKETKAQAESRQEPTINTSQGTSGEQSSAMAPKNLLVYGLIALGAYLILK